jgi:hypothetical protein
MHSCQQRVVLVPHSLALAGLEGCRLCDFSLQMATRQFDNIMHQLQSWVPGILTSQHLSGDISQVVQIARISYLT